MQICTSELLKIHLMASAWSAPLRQTLTRSATGATNAQIAVQMANGVYVDNPDRNFAQIEIDQLIQQVDLVAEKQFNEVRLLMGPKMLAYKQGQPTNAQASSLKTIQQLGSVLTPLTLQRKPTQKRQWSLSNQR